jgi:hypothetical protein
MIRRKIDRIVEVARRLSRREKDEDKALLPINPASDDLYLVEFPKSGITWLCFLAANVNLLLSKDFDQQVTFFNLHGFIPDIHASRFLAPHRFAAPQFRMIKSHSRFNVDYLRTFYLVRDPRHVMVSYHIFLRQTGWFDGSLEEVVKHETFGIDAWHRHVSGWLNGVPASRSFALLRYEDLLADPGKELRAIYKLVGFELSDDIVAKAIERSSIERMRSLEEEANARHPAKTRMEFVRREGVGGARSRLPDEVVEHIERAAGPLMRRLGYQLSG